MAGLYVSNRRMTCLSNTHGKENSKYQQPKCSHVDNACYVFDVLGCTEVAWDKW